MPRCLHGWPGRLAMTKRTKGGEEDAEITALKAKIGAILEAAQTSGVLDEAALAELPAELAGQLRTAWANRTG